MILRNFSELARRRWFTRAGSSAESVQREVTRLSIASGATSTRSTTTAAGSTTSGTTAAASANSTASAAGSKISSAKWTA